MTHTAVATGSPASVRPLARTALIVAGLNTLLAALFSAALQNTFLDLLVTSQVIGFSVWLTLRPVLHARIPAWLRGIGIAAALFFGATLGTVLVNVVKGRNLIETITVGEGPARFLFTVMLGVVVGAAVTTAWSVRTRIARTEAEMIRLEAERQRLARQHAEAELAVVRAQIEPHFLFNTLANLSFLIKDNPPQAQAMLENLIDYLQAALPRIRGESSTLRAELAMATSYVSILQIRMGTRLQATFDVPAELLALPVPPMMLITLVENAIKHGLNELAEGGMLTVSARREGERLVLRVTDTGVGLASSGTPLRHGFGLDNIRDRLTAMYGANASLTLAANTPRGVVAQIALPV